MRRNPNCIKCGEPITAKTSSYCKTCHAKWSRDDRAKDPTSYRARGKARHARIMEALRAGHPTLDWATAVLAKSRTKAKARGHSPIVATRQQLLDAYYASHGRCNACGDAFTAPQVDHDHKTGTLRGFLCVTCNLGEGHLKTRERWLALGLYMGWTSRSGVDARCEPPEQLRLF